MPKTKTDVPISFGMKVSGISSFYIKTDPWRYAEEKENKPFNQIPLERR